MSTKLYEGFRIEHGCCVLVNGEPLDPRHDLRCHSPDGFEWNYGGSGPAQLALGLAADLLGSDDLALAIYQQLKWKVVSILNHERWQLTDDELRARIAEILAERLPPLSHD